MIAVAFPFDSSRASPLYSARVNSAGAGLAGGRFMETFPDRLMEAIDRKGCAITVGIDPRLDLMPPGLVRTSFTRLGEPHRAASQAIRDFNLQLLDAIAPHVPAVKVQVAFYEAFRPAVV